MNGIPGLKELHLLLTYRCDSECDHCFVWSSPRSWVTMSLDQVREMLDQAADIGTIRTIYFEGGEPFLYYPILAAGVEYAHEKGFDIGVVTNAYWASSENDAKLWLEPLLDKGITDFSISTDEYHGGEVEAANAKRAERAARDLGLPVNVLKVQDARRKASPEEGQETLYFRGRAAEKLVKDAEKRPWEELGGCPENPPDIRRLHLDPFGHVLFCQGISIGNINVQPLSRIVEGFVPDKHPIVGPLIKGGVAELARKAGFMPDGKYADPCHLCYTIRLEMISKRMYRNILRPLQAYGMDGID